MPIIKEKKALLANAKKEKKAKQKSVKHLTLKTDVHELSNMDDEKNEKKKKIHSCKYLLTFQSNNTLPLLGQKHKIKTNTE